MCSRYPSPFYSSCLRHRIRVLVHSHRAKRLVAMNLPFLRRSIGKMKCALEISSILLSAPKRSAERTDPRPHFFTSRPCVHRRDREPSWTSNTHICKSDQQCNFRSAVLFLRRPSLQLAWRQQRGCDSAAFSHHCFWSVSTHFFLFARLFWNNRSMGYARLSWPFSGLT